MGFPYFSTNPAYISTISRYNLPKVVCIRLLHRVFDRNERAEMFQFEFETALFKLTAPPQRSPLLQLPSTIAKEVTKDRAGAHKIRFS